MEAEDQIVFFFAVFHQIWTVFEHILKNEMEFFSSTKFDHLWRQQTTNQTENRQFQHIKTAQNDLYVHQWKYSSNKIFANLFISAFWVKYFRPNLLWNYWLNICLTLFLFVFKKHSNLVTYLNIQTKTMSRFMKITLLMLLCSLLCAINAFIVEDDTLLIDKGTYTYFYNYNLLYKEFLGYKTYFSNWPKLPLK